MKILFYANKPAPRLKYIADFLLGQILGFEIQYVHSIEKESIANTISIQYGHARHSDTALFIPAHPFLASTEISEPTITIKKEAGLPSFFFVPEVKDSDLPFDLFAMAFYLLSRYEEYLPDVVYDEHDRFPATASLAFRHKFLRQPLIDQWAMKLYGLLQQRFPFCPAIKPVYRFQSTIDVDFAWAYLYKGWWRNMGGLFKEALTLQWHFLNNRIRVWLGQQSDPYYTFDFLQRLHRQHDLKPLFFMLVAQQGIFDKNNSPDHPAMQKLIRKLSGMADMGIHPSYASNKTPALLTKEKKALEHILGQPIYNNRQHFLCMRFPNTYRRLLAEGIRSDYTMGYADEVGFRASTAYPFYWYDLEKEAVTHLCVFPFQVMDVTLKNYLHLNEKAAIALCTELIHKVKSTGGVFTVIWHNSSFSEQMGWTGWDKVYEKLLALASGD